jgi:hypothetical protein
MLLWRELQIDPTSAVLNRIFQHRLTRIIRLNGITVQMSCSEYLRIRQHYDAALRRWAQIELSSHKFEVFDASARLADKVRQKALDERNEARQRMRLHEENCPACNPRRKPHMVN